MLNKICFIMPFHISQRGGGAEVQAWLYAKEMAKMGYLVSYIAQTIDKNKPKSEIIEGVEVHWIKFQKYFESFNARRNYKQLKEINPDIVIQRMTNFTTGLAAYYCKKNKKKFVWICTDNFSPFKNSFRKRVKIKDNLFIVNQILHFFIFYLNSLILDFSKNYGIKNATICLYQNQFQYEQIKRVFNRTPLKIISGHPAPANIIAPNKRFQNKLIIWVGNLGRNKQPEKFIELSNKMQDSEFKFVIIGNKDDDIRIAELKRLATNVTFVGQIPFSSVDEWFDKAFLFVNTSLHEGFPNTFIQAWLRGVPVISMCVDPDNVIKNNELGFVENKLDRILEKINFLKNNEAIYSQLSIQIRNFAKLNFDIQSVVAKFLIKIIDDDI